MYIFTKITYFYHYYIHFSKKYKESIPINKYD